MLLVFLNHDFKGNNVENQNKHWWKTLDITLNLFYCIGDSLSSHNGMKFTTRNRDNDRKPGTNCAVQFIGGWWYYHCHASNLNGIYLGGRHRFQSQGVIWDSFKGNYYSLRTTTMMVKRHF